MTTPKLLKLAEPILGKLLPRKFVRHYLRPLAVSLFRPNRKFALYDAKRYFESWHKSTEEFSDGATIDPKYDPRFARYHYNAVENSIIEYFACRQFPPNASVLDVGCGAGHWVDFYLEVFGASEVTGIEISRLSTAALQQKYGGMNNVCILEADISSPDFFLDKQFDIINAIGVMFHIVDDNAWQLAVKNLATHLKKDGVMIIGGQFGLIAQNPYYTYTDKFSSWEEAKNTRSDTALIIKRIRSLRMWKACAKKAGLRVEGLIKTKQGKGINTPENNILILGAPAK
jgi:SAM-dependent methyltransferase